MNKLILIFSIFLCSNSYAQLDNSDPVSIDDDGGTYSSPSTLVQCRWTTVNYYSMSLYPTLANALSTWAYHAHNSPSSGVYPQVHDCCQESAFNTFDDVVTTSAGVYTAPTQTGYWAIAPLQALCSSTSSDSGQ